MGSFSTVFKQGPFVVSLTEIGMEMSHFQAAAAFVQTSEFSEADKKSLLGAVQVIERKAAAGQLNDLIMRISDRPALDRAVAVHIIPDLARIVGDYDFDPRGEVTNLLLAEVAGVGASGAALAVAIDNARARLGDAVFRVATHVLEGIKMAGRRHVLLIMGFREAAAQAAQEAAAAAPAP